MRFAVEAVLSTVSLVDMERRDFGDGAVRRHGLRGVDALHRAVAVRMDVDEMITYDVELHDAARAAGLTVVAPS